MRIINTEINIFHNKIENMRRKTIEIEDILSDEFVTPFNILPIPDEAPQEIPRLVSNSKSLHTEIQMSQIFTKLVIKYDNEYHDDWEKCKEYIFSKIEKMYSLLNTIVDGDYRFVGITTNLHIDDKNAIDVLCSKFISVNKKDKSIEELSTRVAFVDEERYFVNLKLSTPSIDIGDKSINQAKIVKVIGVSIDINDKYNLNYNKGNKSDVNSAKIELEKMDDIIKNKIDAILESGVISI